MSPEAFLKEFGHLAETEGGVEKLRRLGLSLAVRGKMGTGRSTDPSAVSLLRDIADRRAALADKLGARPSEIKQAISSERLPENWVGVPLGIFGVFLGGGTPSKSVTRFWGGSIPWVTPKDMKRPVIDSAIDTITEDAVEESSTKLVPPGAILMVLRGMILAHSFPVARTTVTVTINQDMKALVPIDVEWSNFLLIALQEARDRVLASIERSSHGTCRLDADVLLHLPVWLPPLPEQKRIVEKVDQLMALCDELETKQKEKRAKAVSFNQAALNAVVHAPDKAKLKSSWSRVQDHFEVLYELPENVKELRQTILQLAVMGKLVRQDPKDEHPSQVLQRSEETYAEGVRKGIFSKSRAQDVVELPDDTLPPGWAWTSIGRTFEVAGGIQKTPKRRPVRNHFPYLRVENVQRGRLHLDRLERYELFDGELERSRLHAGDLLVVEGNGSEKEIGRCAVWDGSVPDCVHQNHLIRCRPVGHEAGSFVLLFLNSPAGIGEMKKLAVTTSGLYNLSVGKIRGIAFPMPPAGEQKRIIQEVERLTRLCDELEARLGQHRDQGQRLMRAVVESLVA